MWSHIFLWTYLLSEVKPFGTNSEDCLTPFCSCRNLDQNSDYVECEDYFERIYLQCIVSCPHEDLLCLPNCNRDYDTNVKECPCQENCPNGCPCPNYTCQGTTTPTVTTTTSVATTATTTTMPFVQNKTALVLNSWNGWKPAVLVNSEGKQEELGCFTFDQDSEAQYSCSLVWNNEPYIFGGRYKKRQISKVNSYKLQVVGSLPFDLHTGACTNMADRKLFLCFDLSHKKVCHWTTEPLGSFKTISDTTYNHDQIRIDSSERKL